MPEPDILKATTFATPEELAQWLQVNHDTKVELWIKLYKKSTGIPSITWDEIVIECLCWGWIDGIKKSIDEQAYLQRITPRKARSNWSKRNTEHVALLISKGRMMASGLKQVEAAKADGRWESAYVVSEMEVPEDFIKALESQPKAQQFYTTLNKASRYAIAYGLISAKKTDTRQRRFTKFMAMLASEEKPK